MINKAATHSCIEKHSAALRRYESSCTQLMHMMFLEKTLDFLKEIIKITNPVALCHSFNKVVEKKCKKNEKAATNGRLSGKNSSVH